MSKAGKIILWLVVAIIVVGGIWYFTKGGSAPAPVTDNTTATTTVADQGTAATILSTKDNTDASISTDLEMVDGQLNALNTDSATVDKDLSDKQIPQE